MKKIIILILCLAFFPLISFGFEIESHADEVLNEYTNEIAKEIRTNVPITFTQTPVTFEIKINKDGSLRECTITSSSGNEEFDRAVVETAKKLAPYKPLPESFKEEYIEAQYSFGYRIKRYNVKHDEELIQEE